MRKIAGRSDCIMCGCFVLAPHWWFALNNGPPFLAIYWPLCKRTYYTSVLLTLCLPACLPALCRLALPSLSYDVRALHIATQRGTAFVLLSSSRFRSQRATSLLHCAYICTASWHLQHGFYNKVNRMFTSVLSRNNQIHVSLRRANMIFLPQAAKRRGWK